jgi:hypothetical protein
MNLYKFHSDPTQLNGFDSSHNIPYVFVGLWPALRFPIFPKDLTAKQISLIAKVPEFAYYYAKDVVKGRWLEAEPYIMKDSYWWDRYETYFLFD